MTADPHTANSAPREPLYARLAASTPLPGPSRRPSGSCGPHGAAQAIRSHQKTMSTAKLLRLFTPTEQTITPSHDWDTEAAWLYQNHADRMAKLRASIAKLGIEEPIRLCWGHPDCCQALHVVDGHHRAILARDMGLKRVPVADAWDGSEWFIHSW